MHDLDSAATPALAEGGTTGLESVGSQNNDVEVNMIIKEFEAQALLQVQTVFCMEPRPRVQSAHMLAQALLQVQTLLCMERCSRHIKLHLSKVSCS